MTSKIVSIVPKIKEKALKKYAQFAVAKQEVADEAVATIHSEDASLGDKAFARVALATVAMATPMLVASPIAALGQGKSTINNKIDSGGTAIVEILIKFGSVAAVIMFMYHVICIITTSDERKIAIHMGKIKTVFICIIALYSAPLFFQSAVSLSDSGGNPSSKPWSTN